MCSSYNIATYNTYKLQISSKLLVILLGQSYIHNITDFFLSVSFSLKVGCIYLVSKQAKGLGIILHSFFAFFVIRIQLGFIITGLALSLDPIVIQKQLLSLAMKVVCEGTCYQILWRLTSIADSCSNHIGFTLLNVVTVARQLLWLIKRYEEYA